MRCGVGGDRVQSESEAAERPPALCPEPMDFNRFMSPVPPGAPQEELSPAAPTAGRNSGPESRAGPDQRGRTDGQRSHHSVDREDPPKESSSEVPCRTFMFPAFLVCLALNSVTMLCDDGYDHSHTLRVASVTCVCVTATLLD